MKFETAAGLQQPRPVSMQAAVYRGAGEVSVESAAVPAIGPGELLVRVESCGICHTDLKKILHNLLPPPRIFGHETAGTVVEAGPGAGDFRPGDRVALFHHVPCRKCFYCLRRLYAQCETYKRVGITAGYEPSGGGFAQYVRVMDWITSHGVVRIPAGVSFDRACFVEPVNTCLKAVVKCEIQAGECVAVLGQGPIGLLFTMLLVRRGATVFAADPVAERRELALELGAAGVFDPHRQHDGPPLLAAVREFTAGRGCDAVFVAAAAPGLPAQAVDLTRPGGRVLLFAQTSPGQTMELDAAAICAQERLVLGCYSADIDLQEESARLVFDGDLPVEALISHRLPLAEIRSGIRMAKLPEAGSLKIIVHPQK